MGRHCVCMEWTACYFVRTAILPRWSYGFRAIPNKSPIAWLAEMDTLVLKFTWNWKGAQIAKQPQKKENKAGGCTSLISKPTTKLVSSGRRGAGVRIDTDPGTRIESLEIHPYSCIQLTFHRAGETIQWGKNHLFNKWWQDNWISTCKKS